MEVNMSDDLKKPQLRALQYWLVDGVGELFVGFFFLLVAIVYYLKESAPGTILSKIFSIASVILVCGGAFGSRWIIQRIKERTTYPNTGYVTYNSGWNKKNNSAIAIVVMTLLLAYVIITLVIDTKFIDWGPVVGGLFMGILLVQVGYRFATPRLYILAFLGLLIGAGLVISGLSLVLGWPLFFGLFGLILITSGSLTLRKYLCQTSGPAGVLG
jgi:hypothetical protein